MPRKHNVNVTTAQASKARRVRLPKTKPLIVPLSVPSSDGILHAGSSIIVPSLDDIRQHGNLVFAPSSAEIEQFGHAEHAIYDALHDETDAVPFIVPADTMPQHVNSPANPATMLTVVNPPAAEQPAATTAEINLSERDLARKAAALAVREFYAGASLPFKAAVDLRYRAAINFARFMPGTISGTERTAAALAAILAYCSVEPNGTFVRGSGRVPRRMLGLTDRPDDMLNAGIESGVLSRLIGAGAISYVNGVTNGIGAENAVLRVNYAKARANMLAHNEKQTTGEHKFSRALALLDLAIPANQR